LLAQVITQDASVAMLDMWPLWNPSIVGGPSAAAASPQQRGRERGQGLPDDDLLATYSPSPRKRDGPQYVRRKRNHDDTAATSASQDTELGAPDGRQRSLKLRFRQPMHRDENEDEDEDDGHTSVVALGPRPHAGDKAAKREDDEHEEDDDDDGEEDEEEAEREEWKGPEAKAHRPQTRPTDEESGRTRDILFWSDDDDDEGEAEEGNARGGVSGSKPLSASYTRKRRRPHEGDNTGGGGGGGSAPVEQQRKGLALKRGAPPSPPSAASKKRADVAGKRPRTLQESAQQKNANKRAATKTRASRTHAEQDEESNTPPPLSSSPAAARKRAPKKAPSGGQQQRERKGKKGRGTVVTTLDDSSSATTTTTAATATGAKSRRRAAATQDNKERGSPSTARPTTLARSRSRTRLEKEEAEEERKTRWINPYDRMAEEIDEDEAAGRAGEGGHDDDDPEDDPFDFDGHQKRREKALRQEQDELLAFLGKKALPTRRPAVAAPRITTAAMKTKTKTRGTASSRGGSGRDVFDFDDFGDEHDA
jgi:hypothetical protein